MMFFKSAITLSALLVVASAFTIERNVPATEERRLIVSTPSEVITHHHQAANGFIALLTGSSSSCEKEDEDDCKAFCGLSEQSATCKADGNKVTCSCKGGKAPEQNCEERCLLCMPGKAALEEAKEMFKLGGTRVEL